MKEYIERKALEKSVHTGMTIIEAIEMWDLHIKLWEALYE